MSDAIHSYCPLQTITSAAQLNIRGRILAAARQRCGRSSHNGVTVQELARYAGVPESQVREHFADMQTVMIALQRSLKPRGARPASGRKPRAPLKTAEGQTRVFATA